MAGLMQSANVFAAGTGMQAGSQIAGGIAQRRAGSFMGAQADAAAGQAQAASQRTAGDVERRAKILQSNALASAAASGAGASDPTVLDVVSRIAGEGAYRSQLALYEGNEQARALRMRGDVARFEGQQAQRAGITNALGTVLRGGYTLFDKYGKKKSVLTGGNGTGGVDPYVDDSGWGMT